MRKLMLYISTVLTVTTFTSCGPTPDSLAHENIRLHEELEKAANRNDSDFIYREIAAVQTQARTSFRKAELKEYERLAHPDE